MDAALCRFLDVVRPAARPPHRATYENVVAALDCFLTHRRRTARSLRTCELRSFLGYWYLRHYRPAHGDATRRFCAALCVLVGWLSRERAAPRGSALRREVTSLARQTSRAARASDLLQHGLPRPGSWAGAPSQDGYWEVVLLGTSHVVLRHLVSGDTVGPVLLPDDVVRVLLPGTLLNLALVREASHWRVVEHGLCYPPVAAPALRAACLAPV